VSFLEVRNLKVHFPVKHGVFSSVKAWVKAVEDMSLKIATDRRVRCPLWR